MARIFIDGFEGGSGLWTGAGIVDTPLGGWNGGRYLSVSNTGGTAITRVLSTSLAEIYVSFKFKGATYGYPWFTLYNGTTRLGYIRFNDNNTIVLCNNDGTVLATSELLTNVIDRWYTIEFYYKPSTTAGAITLKWDHSTVLTFLGATSQSNLPITAIGLNSLNYYYGSNSSYFDDIVVDSSNWIGNVTIQGLSPSGAGAVTGFLNSSGAAVATNYTFIDDIPNTTTTYLYTTDADVLESMATTNLDITSAVPIVISSVQVQVIAARLGSPVATGVEPKVVIDGTAYPLADTATNLSPVTQSIVTMFNVNPTTGTSWLTSEIDTLELAFKTKA